MNAGYLLLKFNHLRDQVLDNTLKALELFAQKAETWEEDRKQ